MAELINNKLKHLFNIFCIGIIVFFLASCDSEKNRSESDYIEMATEAHAIGESKRAIFELGAGIKHYPKNPDLQILRGKIFLDLEDGSAAEIAFNKAISLGYNKNLIKHELAEAWLYQRNPAKIIETLGKEITNGSQDALVYEIVGRAYIASKNRSNSALFIQNMAKAKKYINEAYRLSPNNTRVLITKAWLPAMAGNISEAMTWLNKADLIVKDQRQNLSMQGELLIRQNKVDQAQAIYLKLSKKFPQYPRYKLELGYTYLLNNDYGNAREWIEPVALKYPNQLRAQYLLSSISFMEKKYKDAEKLSDAVLAITPDDLKTVIINGASSYFLGNYENAHQKLSLFYNRTGSIQALKLLAATKLKLNENNGASKLLTDAGQKTNLQSDTEFLNLVAIASAKIGKTDISLDTYKKLAKQQPNTASYRSNIGLLQITQGNYKEGFDNLEKALNKNIAAKDSGQNLFLLASKALDIHQYDRANNYIEQYKKIAPDSYKPWVMSAVLNSILKNNDAVHQDFKKAMKLAPNDARIRTRYAIFERMQGHMGKSLTLAKEALKLDPSDIGAGKILISELIKQKNFSEIKNIVDNAINAKNAPPVSKLLFADYYTMLGSPQKTLTILNLLPEPLKKSASFKFISGKSLLRNGQAQSAVDILEDLSIDVPNNILALKYLLSGYVLTGNQKKYKSTLEKLSQLEPDDYATQLELTKLYIMTDKYNQAESILNSIKPKDDQEALQKKTMRASLETKRKNFKKSLAILAPLNKKYPENGGISMLYARSLANDNQINKAISVTQAWADMHPKNVAAKEFLGDLYLGNKDNAKAQKLYEAIIAIDKNSKARTVLHAHNNLAMIFIETARNKLALKHAQTAIDMAPNNPAILDTYAQALMATGQPKKAIDNFNHAIDLLPVQNRKSLSAFTLNKAKAQHQAGQKEEAQKTLTHLIRDDPSFSKIDEAKRLLSTL